MIDSHCHLDHEPLLGDLDNVLLRSKNIGISIASASIQISIPIMLSIDLKSLIVFVN